MSCYIQHTSAVSKSPTCLSTAVDDGRNTTRTGEKILQSQNERDVEKVLQCLLTVDTKLES